MNFAHPWVREAVDPAAVRDEVVEFSIHDLLGIRLVGASRRDVLAIGRQLGLDPVVLVAPPALTIRFVDQLPVGGPLRYIGREDVAFTDDAFLLLRSRNLARARTCIPFETIGAGCEI